jgi:putative spermidine/putrescine transport system permease protein
VTARTRSGKAGAARPYRYAGVALCAPLLLLFVIAFVAPLLASVMMSFHALDPSGVPSSGWTLENYAALADAYYLTILGRTLRVGLEVTAFSAVLAYPVALFIARASRTLQTFLLFIYIAPWFVNVAVKALGWTFLLSPHGLINDMLVRLGLIAAPLRLMNNEVGVVIGLVHVSLVVLVLPLNAAIQGIDRNLLAAARNLGAGEWQVFARIVLPLTLPSLMVGIIIVYLLTITAFATPTLLGGVSTPMVAFLTYQVNLVKLDWPLGSAMAVAFLAVTLAVLAGLRMITRSATRWSEP